MNALARRTAAFAAACLLFAVVLPGAQAQVPPPPTPDTSGCTWDDLFPVLDWVGDCATLEYGYFGEVVDWLRCDILGGAAC